MTALSQHIRLAAVHLSQRLGIYDKCLAIDTRYRNRRLARAFHQYGLETLVQASEALQKAGITFFPTCGTLLGAYREHDFIQHDCDLDAGVLITSDDTPLQVQQVLIDAGFAHTQQLFMRENHRIIEDRFVWKGVQLDIFYYFQEADKYYCYFSRPHETLPWREANQADGFPVHRSYMPLCTFEKQPFLGYHFFMPTETAAWLAGMYGEDFMTPIQEWQPNQKRKTTTINCGERVYRWH